MIPSLQDPCELRLRVSSVDFNETVDIFKENNHRILLACNCDCILSLFCCYTPCVGNYDIIIFKFWGGNPRAPRMKPCSLSVMMLYLAIAISYINICQYFAHSIWRHGSASILGTTRTVTHAPILMYWAGLSQIASPRERKSK